MFEQYDKEFKVELNDGFRPYLIHKIDALTLTDNIMTVSEAFRKAEGNGSLFCTEEISLKAAKLLKELYDTTGVEINNPLTLAILNFNRTEPLEYFGDNEDQKKVVKMANVYLGFESVFVAEADGSIVGSVEDFVAYMRSLVKKAQSC